MNILQRFRGIFVKQNEKLSPLRQYWKKLPGKDDGEKLSLIIKKYHLFATEFAKQIGYSNIYVHKISHNIFKVSDSFIEKVLEYENNPKRPVYTCKKCGNQFDGSSIRDFCNNCKVKPKPRKDNAALLSYWNELPGKDDKKKILNILQKYGLLKADLARLIGIDGSLISHILKGNRNAGIKFISGLYKYEQKPREPEKHNLICFSCEGKFQHDRRIKYCPACKNAKNRYQLRLPLIN